MPINVPNAVVNRLKFTAPRFLNILRKKVEKDVNIEVKTETIFVRAIMTAKHEANFQVNNG